jgi:hypothetical protein
LQYHGTPISLFPVAQYENHLSRSILLSDDHLQVPLIEVAVPQADPVAQLLQGLQSMFTKQEQDRIADRVERHHFEATVQGLPDPLSCPGLGLVVFRLPGCPVSEPVPVGQYNPVPAQHSEPQPILFSLFPSAQANHHRTPRLNYPCQ